MNPIEISVRAVIDEESFSRAKARIAELQAPASWPRCRTCRFYQAEGYHSGRCEDGRMRSMLRTSDQQFIPVCDSFGCVNHETKSNEAIHG